MNYGSGVFYGLARGGCQGGWGMPWAGVSLFLRRTDIDTAATAVVVTSFIDVWRFLLSLGIAASDLSFLV